MNYNVEIVENKAKIRIELTSEEWKTAIAQAYQKTKSEYSVQGFRKGFVPQKVIEKMYGVQTFFNEALSIIFPIYYGEVLDKEPDLFVVSDPEVDFEKIDADNLVMILDVELKPEVVVENYKGINIEKIEYNVTDDDVDAELKKAQERIAREVEVTDRAVDIGDTVNIDYSGSVDGVKFEGGTAEKQDLTIGSGKFIPGFEEQLVGMNIGEEKDITVTFPENYSPELASKQAVFAIKLHSIKAKEMPELSDEFAKDVSEFDTLEAYKEDIRKNLQAQNDKKAEEEMLAKLIETIADGVNINVPSAMTQRQVENQIKMNDQQVQMYYGMNFEALLKMQGQTIDDYKKAITASCERKVKVSLILDAIAKQENIEADEESIDKRIKFLADSIKKDYEEYKKTVKEEQLGYIKEDIINEKLLTFLKESNNLA